MGDGQHVWASAEWVMMLRNMFVREEYSERMLILCSGIPGAWLIPKEIIFLGPTQTVYGEISVTIKIREDIEVSWQAKWNGPAPRIEVRLPGFETHLVEGDKTSVKIEMMELTA